LRKTEQDCPVTPAPAGSGELLQIVYSSRSLLGGATAALSAGISDILRVSRHKNACENITGALFFNGRAFTQALEGPPLAVARLYANILKDKRHTDICLLRHEAIAKRCFEGWAMAFVEGDGGGGFAITPGLLQDILQTSDGRAEPALHLMKQAMAEK